MSATDEHWRRGVTSSYVTQLQEVATSLRKVLDDHMKTPNAAAPNGSTEAAPARPPTATAPQRPSTVDSSAALADAMWRGEMRRLSILLQSEAERYALLDTQAPVVSSAAMLKEWPSSRVGSISVRSRPTIPSQPGPPRFRTPSPRSVGNTTARASVPAAPPPPPLPLLSASARSSVPDAGYPGASVSGGSSIGRAGARRVPEPMEDEQAEWHPRDVALNSAHLQDGTHVTRTPLVRVFKDDLLFSTTGAFPTVHGAKASDVSYLAEMSSERHRQLAGRSAGRREPSWLASSGSTHSQAGPHGTGPHGTGLQGTGPHGTGLQGTGLQGTGLQGTGPHGTGPQGMSTGDTAWTRGTGGSGVGDGSLNFERSLVAMSERGMIAPDGGAPSAYLGLAPTGSKAKRKPASRADAVSVAARLHTALDQIEDEHARIEHASSMVVPLAGTGADGANGVGRMNGHANLEREEISVLEGALAHVAAQVKVGCTERGEVLEIISGRLSTILSRLVGDKEVIYARAQEELQQSLRAAKELEEERRRKERATMHWLRANSAIKSELLNEDDEERLVQIRSLQQDKDQADIFIKLQAEQLNKVRAQLAAETARAGSLPMEELEAQVMRAGVEVQRHVSLALLGKDSKSMLRMTMEEAEVQAYILGLVDGHTAEQKAATMVSVVSALGGGAIDALVAAMLAKYEPESLARALCGHLYMDDEAKRASKCGVDPSAERRKRVASSLSLLMGKGMVYAPELLDLVRAELGMGLGAAEATRLQSTIDALEASLRSHREISVHKENDLRNTRDELRAMQRSLEEQRSSAQEALDSSMNAAEDLTRAVEEAERLRAVLMGLVGEDELEKVLAGGGGGGKASGKKERGGKKGKRGGRRSVGGGDDVGDDAFAAELSARIQQLEAANKELSTKNATLAAAKSSLQARVDATGEQQPSAGGETSALQRELAEMLVQLEAAQEDAARARGDEAKAAAKAGVLAVEVHELKESLDLTVTSAKVNEESSTKAMVELRERIDELGDVLFSSHENGADEKLDEKVQRVREAAGELGLKIASASGVHELLGTALNAVGQTHDDLVEQICSGAGGALAAVLSGDVDVVEEDAAALVAMEQTAYQYREALQKSNSRVKTLEWQLARLRSDTERMEQRMSVALRSLDARVAAAESAYAAATTANAESANVFATRVVGGVGELEKLENVPLGGLRIDDIVRVGKGDVARRFEGTLVAVQVEGSTFGDKANGSVLIDNGQGGTPTPRKIGEQVGAGSVNRGEGAAYIRITSLLPAAGEAPAPKRQALQRGMSNRGMATDQEGATTGRELLARRVSSRGMIAAAPAAANTTGGEYEDEYDENSITIGNLTLDLEGHKPMSLAFLYRMISSLMEAKMAYDVQARQSLLERQYANPEAAIGLQHDEFTVDMPAFVVARLFETYGVPNLAKRYLCEMLVGLRVHADESLRLEMFADALGVPFSTDGTSVRKYKRRGVIPPHRFSLMLSVLLSTVTLLDNERGLTKTRKDQFLARLGEYNELYVPFAYLMRGMGMAIASDLNPDFREDFAEAVELNAQPLLLADSAACQADARTRQHKRKGTVLGGTFGGPFMNIDRFLNLVLKAHREMMDKRSKVVQTMFKKYDESGDVCAPPPPAAAVRRHRPSPPPICPPPPPAPTARPVPASSPHPLGD